MTHSTFSKLCFKMCRKIMKKNDRACHWNSRAQTNSLFFSLSLSLSVSQYLGSCRGQADLRTFLFICFVVLNIFG